MILSNFNEYRKKVNWTLFGLICFFTMGSWIDISGIWCELPIMVNTLPEGWRLPAILTVTSQLAQIGPFLFFAGRLIWPNHFGNVKTIYFIFFVGAASCLSLSFFWDRTFIVFNENRSILLYLFNFTLSLLDGMSTITFLPYIGEHFVKEYIISNYVGESLSSLVPGVLGILQGIESITSDNCSLANSTLTNVTNSTSNETTSLNLELTDPTTGVETPKLRFSVSVYFFFMFGLICLSAVSFTIINFWERMRAKRKVNAESNSNVESSSSMEKPSMGLRGDRLAVEMGVGLSDEANETTQASYEKVVASSLRSQQASNSISSNRKEISFLFCLTFIISFVCYGYLPGIFSYSTIPYGIRYFHLATNISCICLPLSILLSIWSYEVSLRRIVLESTLPLLISVYILTLAVLSPCPPMVGTDHGGYLAVAAWVLSSCGFMRIRCLIATKLERYGKNILFSIGCFTILGQVIGGLLIFTQVEIYRQFQELPKCSSSLQCSQE